MRAKIVKQDLKAPFLFALCQVVRRPVLLVSRTARDFIRHNVRPLDTAFPLARQTDGENVLACFLPKQEILASARDGIQCNTVFRRAGLRRNQPYAVIENDSLTGRYFQGFEFSHIHRPLSRIESSSSAGLSLAKNWL